jgi:hypothetical protein
MLRVFCEQGRLGIEGIQVRIHGAIYSTTTLPVIFG